MNRLRVFGAVLAVILFVCACSAPVQAQTNAPAASPAFILVDNDSGEVLASNNDRTPFHPASTTKLLTALVAIHEIPSDRLVPISADAAAMPAMKIGAKVGEMWNRDDLLRSLLMVSANDAAVALAQESAGDLADFSTMRARAGQQLGLSDSPSFNDPAGLDDDMFSNGGGDLISARDMAIVGRAALSDPLISSIAGTKKYNFDGPDGAAHSLTNHNKLLSSYEGAIGLKTGYTTKAKNTFVGAATRNGRTMLVVVMGADNPYTLSVQLLDQGFATPIGNQSTSNELLPSNALDSLAESAAVPEPIAVAAIDRHSLIVTTTLALIGLLGLVTLALWARDRQLAR